MGVVVRIQVYRLPHISYPYSSCICSFLQWHILYSMFLSREETFANFVFLWRFAKVFSVKIYFQAIRYRASGCGALGCRKFAKVFSAKINFQAIRKSFLPRKKPAIRYIIYIYI